MRRRRNRGRRVSRSRVYQWIPWACAVVAIALAAVVWIRGRPRTDTPAPLVQFEVELKSDGVLASDVGTAVVVSPDGTRVVFVSRTADGRTHLSTRRLDQPTAIPLPGTDGARGPFVSPDGRWVGFWADGKLKKVSVDGGSPVILCDASDLLGASWGEGDTIIAALGAPGKLWRIPAEGGVPQVAIDISAESTGARWPQILPGGQFVMYTATAGAGADRATIEVQSIRGGNRKVLVSGGAFGRYLTSGHLAYVNQGTLYAMPFDLEQLAVHGAAVPVLDDVLVLTVVRVCPDGRVADGYACLPQGCRKRVVRRRLDRPRGEEDAAPRKARSVRVAPPFAGRPPPCRHGDRERRRKHPAV